MISVIVPTYNAERYLAETLRSIFAQTLPPGEILVIDDCSTDGTVALAESLAGESPCPLIVRRLESNSGGPVTPMNTGIAAARGDLIALLDHDDIAAPTRLADSAPIFAEHEDVGIVFGKQRIIDSIGNELDSLGRIYESFKDQQPYLISDIALRNLLTIGYRYGGAGGKVFRKSVWECVGGFKPEYRIRWDYLFAIEATLRGVDVYFLDRLVLSHRVHDGNLEQSEGGIRSIQESINLFDFLDKTYTKSSEVADWIASRRAKNYILAANKMRSLGRYRDEWPYLLQALKHRESRSWAIKTMLKYPAAMIYRIFLRQLTA